MAQLSASGHTVLDYLGGPDGITGALKSRELSMAEAEEEVREIGNTRGLDGFDTPLQLQDIQEKGIYIRGNVGSLMSGEAPSQQ